MTERLVLEIDSIAAGGDGVARHDGLVVFVPRTAPGDRVLAQVEKGRRFARGRVEAFERESPARVEPRCAHYGPSRCGGCQLQHLGETAQGDAKRAIVRDTMRRIGRRTTDLPAFHRAPSAWRYRQRLSLALRKNSEGAWFGGLHKWDDPAAVFALEDCWITDERVLALWREVLAAADSFPQADALRGTVRLIGARGVLTIEGGRTWPDVDAFIERLPSFDGVWWTAEAGRRRRVGVAAGSPEAASADASFSQVNPAVATPMFSFVEEQIVARVALSLPVHVIDAYSGTGELAAALYARGIRVTAIEFDEEASAFAAGRLTRPSRSIAARVEDVIARVLPADVVVVNPPRAGLDSGVTQALNAAPGTTAIIYVSCDPATLARDVARLPSWSIASMDAFDMFPQTAHVETVVVLTRDRTS
ncbi:MAG: TRAM domain-containing protein [Gemmatimonadetes bacterium]|nr:TRAM domain-containing protein [Gemmatimonadota bacterium]